MQKPYVLGLDMGGTNSVLGVVDARGHVLGRTSIKTQAYRDINDYVNALYEEAQKIGDHTADGMRQMAQRSRR